MVDIINLPPMPGLPDVTLADPSTLSADATALLTADALGVLSALGSSPWGIYSGGSPVVVADTVAEVGYSKASNISSYPVESGGFAAYDKQATPFEGRVRFASGGSAGVREELLASIEAIEDDTNLYDFATPDRIYLNANLTKMEYSRSAQAGGGSLLVVEVGVQEVRIIDGEIGSNTADPASANTVDTGVVQATTVPTFNSASLVVGLLPSSLGGSVGGGATVAQALAFLAARS